VKNFRFLVQMVIVLILLMARATLADDEDSARAVLPVPQMAGTWSGNTYDNVISAPGILTLTLVQHKNTIAGVWKAEFNNCDNVDLIESGTVRGSVKWVDAVPPIGTFTATLKVMSTNSGERHPCAIKVRAELPLTGTTVIGIDGDYTSCKHEVGDISLLPGAGNGQSC